MLETEIVRHKPPHPIPTLGRKRQVLVINDDKIIRDAVSRMLVSLGHSVTLSSSGFDGGLLFCTRDYDLAIIDLHVPQKNVWELSRILKDHSPKTPVILVTWLSGDKHRERSDSNPVDAIIPKPFKLKNIQGTVRRLLDSGT